MLQKVELTIGRKITQASRFLRYACYARIKGLHQHPPRPQSS